MSTRYEWMSDPAVEYVPAGTEIGGFETDTEALLIAGDEVTVVEGDLDLFLQRLRLALTEGRAEADEYAEQGVYLARLDQVSKATCRHCSRSIVLDGGRWVDPEATGDDSVWRETCDAHDTFTAEHEPEGKG